MGVELVYKCGGRELCPEFSEADWDSLNRIWEESDGAVATLADATELGEDEGVLVRDLRDAIDRIDRMLSRYPEPTRYLYQYKAEYWEFGDRRIEIDEFGDGSLAGIRLLGDEEHTYVIRAGLERCCLEKRSNRADRARGPVESRDLRDEQFLETANFGRIRIRKSRVESDLRAKLAEIRRFIERLPDDETIFKLIG